MLTNLDVKQNKTKQNNTKQLSEGKDFPVRHKGTRLYKQDSDH